MKINIIPILSDNYSYIIQSTGVTAIVDPGDAVPIIEYLKENNLVPDYIINTHHHWDHTDGNQDLIDAYNCKVIAPQSEQSKIGQVDIALNEQDEFTIGDATFTSIETKGHTQGHLCYYNDEHKILLSGDMIFVMGCGRPMEGDANDLYEGTQKLKHLPDETLIYCGHEYTITNGKFAQTIEPDNTDINYAIENAQSKRRKGLPTIPTSMEIERKTNPFIRAKSAAEFVTARDKRNNF